MAFRKKIATLSSDHRRELQSRIFKVVATEGYDDHKWWPDLDLDLFVRFIRAEQLDVEKELLEKQQELNVSGSIGQGQALESRQKGIRKTIEDKKENLETLGEELKPFVNEQSRRKEELREASIEQEEPFESK